MSESESLVFVDEKLSWLNYTVGTYTTLSSSRTILESEKTGYFSPFSRHLRIFHPRRIFFSSFLYVLKCFWHITYKYRMYLHISKQYIFLIASELPLLLSVSKRTYIFEHAKIKCIFKPRQPFSLAVLYVDKSQPIFITIIVK